MCFDVQVCMNVSLYVCACVYVSVYVSVCACAKSTLFIKLCLNVTSLRIFLCSIGAMFYYLPRFFWPLKVFLIKAGVQMVSSLLSDRGVKACFYMTTVC